VFAFCENKARVRQKFANKSSFLKVIYCGVDKLVKRSEGRECELRESTFTALTANY
jgi:hypothetical protein